MIANPHLRSLAPYTSFAILMAALIAVGVGHPGAAQAPVNGDDLVYEHFFKRADRGQMMIKFMAEAFEFRR